MNVRSAAAQRRGEKAARALHVLALMLNAPLAKVSTAADYTRAAHLNIHLCYLVRHEAELLVMHHRCYKTASTNRYRLLLNAQQKPNRRRWVHFPVTDEQGLRTPLLARLTFSGRSSSKATCFRALRRNNVALSRPVSTGQGALFFLYSSCQRCHHVN